MSVYFLTGASGVVGSAIVPELLGQTEAEIRILLRPKKGQTVAARLAELESFWLQHYPGLTTAQIRARVRPVAGEITEPALGLSATDREGLVRSCTNIIHCAASVRMNLPLEEARQTALFPVQGVLELGRDCAQLRKAEFVSTVGVGGRWDGPLPERWITEPREFHNTYEAAKAEAEESLKQAVDAGFPATVHRPSMVIGNSVTGAVIHFQIFYFICDFLSGRRTLGIYPNLEKGLLDVIPNDFVARAIVAASLDTETRGNIFHLCAGPARAVRLCDLRVAVRRAFRAARQIGWLPQLDLSARNFTRLMRGMGMFLPEKERRAIDTLPIYLDYLSGVQEFGNERTLRELTSKGIDLPDIDSAIERCLDFHLMATAAPAVSRNS